MPRFNLIRFRSQTGINQICGAMLGLAALHQTISLPAATLGATAFYESASGGASGVILAMEAPDAPWTATANDSWLHVGGTPGGTGSTNIIFTLDANPGPSRSGTMSIAGETLVVTQVGATFAAVNAATVLVATGLSSPTSVSADESGNVFIADRNNSTIKKWTKASNTISTILATGLNLPNAVTVDAAGNLYIADSGNNAIKKWTATTTTVSTLVSTGLTNPYGVAVDRSGNVYFSDAGNNAIKKWSVADASVTTLVNTGLNQPIGVAVDVAGNVYIADAFNGAIKKWSASTSNVTTLISSGLSTPAGVAVDASGNVYVANTFGQNIRKWIAANNSVTTVLSSGLVQPNGVAVDSSGNLYVASTGNNTIRELPRAFVNLATNFISAATGSSNLAVTLPPTVNLQPPFAPVSNQPWLTLGAVTNGSINVNFTANFGTSRTATLTVLGLPVSLSQSGPSFVLATNAASVGFSAGSSSVFLETTPAGAPWTASNQVAWLRLAAGFTNSSGSTNVVFNYDANPGTTRVGALTIAGQIFTVTQAAAPLPEIEVQHPPGVVLVDGTGQIDFGPGLILATNSQKIFTIKNLGETNLTGLTLTIDGANPGDFILGGPGTNNLPVNASTTFSVWFAPGATGPRQAVLHLASNDPDENPFDLTLTGTGFPPTIIPGTTNLLVGATAGSASVVLSVSPQNASWTANAISPWLQLGPGLQTGSGSTNLIITFAANPGPTRTGTISIAGQLLSVTQAGAGYIPAGSVKTLGAAGAFTPYGIAVDAAGNAFIADADHQTIHRWTPTNNSISPLITTGLNFPYGLATDAAGNLYIADTATATIKKWTAATGNVTPVLETNLIAPYGVAVDRAGDIYIADAFANAIQKWTATNGTVAPLISSGLTSPFGVAVDVAGNVYIADSGSHSIKKWTAATATLSTLVGTGLNTPYGVAVDAGGNVYIADSENHAIKKWSPINQTVTPVIAAGLAGPFGVAVDKLGGVFLADTGNQAIKQLPAVLVNPAGVNVPFTAGTEVLPAILPGTANLRAPFTPTSDQAWLTFSSSTNGIVQFAFAANPGGLRQANLNVFGTNIPITQAALPLPEIGVWEAGQELFDGGTSSFGTGLIQVTNVVKTFVITNSGGTNLTGLVVTKNGANAADFIISALPIQNLPANASTTFTVSFAPGAAGNRSAALHLASNDPDENPFDLNLTGAAIAPQIALAATNRLVGPTAGADSIVIKVTPENGVWSASTGTAWLHVSSPSQTGAGSQNVLFTYDANSGITRTGTVTIGGQILTVTQAGASHVAASQLTPLFNSPPSHIQGVEVDVLGNVYFTDRTNHTLSRWNANANTIVTLITNGLLSPAGLTGDRAGNIYIADSGHNAIKRYSTNGNLTTLISSGLNQPCGLAINSAGDLFIAETGSDAIKKWTAASNSVVTLVSGLTDPAAVAVDAAGNVYFADGQLNKIKKWTAASSTVTTLVSGGSIPVSGIEVDAGGNVYFTEFSSGEIRVWRPSPGTNSLLANAPANLSALALDDSGSLYAAQWDATNGIVALARGLVNVAPQSLGFAAGTASIPVALPTSLNLQPPFLPGSDQTWLMVGSASNGNVILNFTGNPGAIRTANLTVLGQVVTISQAALPYTAILGFTNRFVSQSANSDSVVLSLTPGTASNWTAAANAPWLHVAANSQGGGSSTNVIYSIDTNPGATPRTGTMTIANQVVTVVQGGTNFGAISMGQALVSAGLNTPQGVAVDATGNVFILDTYNGLVKRWNPTNNVVTTIISNGLSLAFGIAVDGAGNLYIADSYNSAVKKWSAATGVLSSLVSTGLNLPTAVATDRAGNVYFADTYNYAIKKWSVTNNTVTTLVATGLNLPTGIAVDAAGNVYIGDTYNYAVKKWQPTSGAVTTLIASGLNLPSGLAVDGAGNVLIADRNNHAIKQWLAASNTVISLVTTGLNLPQSIACNPDGSLYIADSYNHIIRGFPRGFVDQSPRVVGNAAGTTNLPVVYPSDVSLWPPFAPSSNQPWLNVFPNQNGSVTLAVTANPGGSRSANVTILGRSVPVLQTLIVTAPSLAFSPLSGGLKLSFAANAGQQYQIESAPAVTGPWVTNTVLIGDSSGFLNYTSAISATGNRFFRTRTP